MVGASICRRNSNQQYVNVYGKGKEENVMTKTNLLRKALAIIIALAMVCTAIPLLSAPFGGSEHKAWAAAGDGTGIVFNYEVNGVITDTVTKDYSQLTADTDMTAWKYLAWSGAAYQVYGVTGATDAISIDRNGATPAGTTLVDQLSALWSKTVTYGTVRFEQADGKIKEYSRNDIASRAQFPTNTTSSALADSPVYTNESGGIKAFITLSAKADPVTATSNDVTPATPVSGLTFCTNLDNRQGTVSSYGSYEKVDDRYKAIGDMPQNIVKITFVNSTTFNVYNQIGDNGRTITKSYSDADLDALAATDKLGFLMIAGTDWTIHATDKYVKILDLIDNAGLVFNAGDKFLIRSSDMFSFSPSYDMIQAEKYFFGGIAPDSVSTANPTEVGAVIALGKHGSVNLTAGTAASTLTGFTVPTATNKRFFIGLSAANAAAKIAAGNRFPTYVTEVTVIKDKADVITDADVTGVAASYKKTAGAITPEVVVTLDGVKLRKDIDYTVTYGVNKEVAGAVAITGKGTVSGTVLKTFDIDDGSKAATAAELEKAKAEAQEQAKKVADQVKKTEDQAKKAADLQKKLDVAQQTIFKAVAPAKSKFKVKAGKMQAAVSWAKIGTANQGYQIQYATKKNFSGKKTVKVKKASTVKTTIRSLKKGKTYYVKMRGVAKIGGKTVYTKWTAARKVKIV
jgi:hypothetical protein